MLQDRATASMMGAIRIPPVERRELHLHEGASGVWLYADADVPPVQVEVPVDFYLREARDLDLNEWRSLATFLETWGIPVDERNRDVLNGEDEIELWARNEGNLSDNARTMHHGREIAAVELGWIDDQSHLSLMQSLADPRENTRRDEIARRLVNLSEATLRLLHMQIFIDVVLGESRQNPADDANAIDDLNAALSPFAPRITIGERDTQRPTIHSVVAAQIANDILAGTPLQTCLNETCGRTFTKQRGRADYGAHRSKGVLYCSKECAKAQAQRELRRRRRLEASK